MSSSPLTLFSPGRRGAEPAQARLLRAILWGVPPHGAWGADGAGASGRRAGARRPAGDPDAMPDPERRPPLIPSHIAWPAFVVFLLAISLTMVAVTVTAARSDGGARLVETAAPGE